MTITSEAISVVSQGVPIKDYWSEITFERIVVIGLGLRSSMLGMFENDITYKFKHKFFSKECKFDGGTLLPIIHDMIAKQKYYYALVR